MRGATCRHTIEFCDGEPGPRADQCGKALAGGDGDLALGEVEDKIFVLQELVALRGTVTCPLAFLAVFCPVELWLDIRVCKA
jgi:hypothetical protein